VSNAPLFILFVSRYTDEGTKALSYEPLALSRELRNESSSPLRSKSSELTIDLNALNQLVLNQFTVNRLHADIAPSLQNFLIRTTQGNPFYADQVIAYLRENDLLLSSDQGMVLSVEHVPLSESLQSVLMARISS
jgi:predicted ATPase